MFDENSDIGRFRPFHVRKNTLKQSSYIGRFQPTSAAFELGDIGCFKPTSAALAQKSSRCYIGRFASNIGHFDPNIGCFDPTSAALTSATFDQTSAALAQHRPLSTAPSRGAVLAYLPFLYLSYPNFSQV